MNKLLLTLLSVLFITVLASCSKGGNEPGSGGTGAFEAITFKFGADATAILIDNENKAVMNMPRGADVTQLVATAVLPSGYSITPDPATAKNYTQGVTYTVTTNSGKKYNLKITAPAYDASTNPYGIYTPLHLSDIRKGMNDSYVLMNDIQLPNLSASDAASTVGISDYATYGWFSIGTTYIDGGHVTFRGSLDGQNHVIKNLTSIFRDGTAPLPTGIDAGHAYKGADGLFGYAAHATFKNIGIELAQQGIKGANQDLDGYSFVGALVGLADTCTFTNCFVTGNTSVIGAQNTGGLIGKARQSIIKKSYSALNPQPGTYAVMASSYAGGLIAGALESQIEDSYSSSSAMGGVAIGGLIGDINTCSVKTSYASGDVTEIPYNTTGSLVASNSIGGLVGSVTSIAPASSTIQNCYSTGSVKGANGTNVSFHSTTNIGGLIGRISAIGGPVSVMYCYAKGLVSRVHTSATVPYLIGGLVGTTHNGVFITSSTCTNYWDKETTGQTVLGGGNSALAQDNGFTANGKTAAEMKTSSTFLNWDFSGVWTVAAGTNNGYPTLKTVIK